ncbi:unnamed protein product, partial [Mesorhabditis belari]|uniref:Pseudouridine synthase RsuA/RluA-like domain-containing protein n=1 Tax=Mesorhabditis belari TaxID=2138241 RepID=A0AAF3EB07_9BILA
MIEEGKTETIREEGNDSQKVQLDLEDEEKESSTSEQQKDIGLKRGSTGGKEKEIERADDTPMNVGYKIVDGIRYLDPYWAPWRTRTKGRWIGRKLVECFAQEFLSANKHYAVVAAKLGRMYVNGKQITDTDYVLKNGDSIEHWGHRHEHPILDCQIKFVADTEDLLVVDKPASLPVHSCGQYSLHTVLGMLRTQHNITGLRVLHRLDRTTSGILMFAKNYRTDLEFKETLKKGHWVKEYVCKVDGVFPEEEIPLQPANWNVGDGKTSVLKAVIDTGRTHQIRVHAQFLGHPIVGDQIYNSDAWGPTRGKDADYQKNYEELGVIIRDRHKMENWLEEVLPGYEEMMERMATGEVTPEPPFIPREQRPEKDSVCLSCNVIKKPPSRAHFSLNLHCLKYETEKWSYETELPDWAIEPHKISNEADS